MSRTSRSAIFAKLDCYDLALGAIDFVVDRMGFDTGADPEAVVGHLFGEIIDWAPDETEDAIEAEARTINEVLIRPQRGLYCGLRAENRWIASNGGRTGASLADVGREGWRLFEWIDGCAFGVWMRRVPGDNYPRGGPAQPG